MTTNTEAIALTPSSFSGLQDLARVKAFLCAQQRRGTLPDYWNTGLSRVGTFHAIYDSPTSHHRFWEDQTGAYQAYLWLHPQAQETIAGEANSWRLLVHPAHKTRAFVNAAIDCAEAQLPTLAGPSAGPIETLCYASDDWLARILLARGYARRGATDVYLQRTLESPIPPPPSVPGYCIRPLNTEADLFPRAGVQSDAFAGLPEPDDWSLRNTKRFFQWYEGRCDLDLVAVTETGEFASFAVFVLDSIALVGELDPVGTRAAHRNKGLARSILLTGLEYMRSHNMRVAVVRTGKDNHAAIRTYESVGFQVLDRLHRYTKGATPG